MTHFAAGARASLPVLLGIVPFGVITGVAWRWRTTFATIIAGLLALHLFDWLL